MDNLTYEKAKNALAYLVSRYQGETGLTARDHEVLSKCIQQILAALDDKKND